MSVSNRSNLASSSSAYPDAETSGSTLTTTLQSTATTTTSEALMPKMTVRRAFFQELPGELQKKIFDDYLRCEPVKDLSELARRSRCFASISKAQLAQVAMWLSEHRELAFAATRGAIPSFIEKRFETMILKSIRPAARMKQLVQEHPVLHADFSFGVQMEWGSSKINSNRRPLKTLELLLSQAVLTTLRLDISGPQTDLSESKFIDVRLNDFKDRYKWIEKHRQFIKRAGEEIKEWALRNTSSVPIELVYRNWPDSTLVDKLLGVIVEKPGAIRALDLSDGFNYSEMTVGIFERQQFDLAANFSDSLCKILKSTHSLQRLMLSNARLGSKSCRSLAAALFENKSLKSLDLSKNTLRRETVDLLAASIGQSTTLETINLSDTDLTNEGADRLLAMLDKNKTIQSLVLHQNKEISPTHPIWDEPRVLGHR